MGLPSLLLLPLIPSAALAQVSPDQIIQALTTFNTHADIALPLPNPAQQKTLSRGGIFKTIQTLDSGNYRVVGMIVAEIPRNQLWIANQHPRYGSYDSLIETMLAADNDRQVWYGFADFPSPFADRHWVVDNWNNHVLAEKTDNRQWEHLWRQHANGVEPARGSAEQGKLEGLDQATFDAAIVIPATLGGVAMLDLGNGWTLMASHSVFDLGGAIPERLLAEYFRQSMDRYFRLQLNRAREQVPVDYRAGGNAVMPGGDGKPLPHFE